MAASSTSGAGSGSGSGSPGGNVGQAGSGGGGGGGGGSGSGSSGGSNTGTHIVRRGSCYFALDGNGTRISECLPSRKAAEQFLLREVNGDLA